MGTVYLVGAGPGDAGLITCRGAELLRRADVVLHDALVDPEMLGLIGPRAEVVDVGRRAGESRGLTQEKINQMLVELGHRHGVVVRLKGGDPFVFGRGGEEALALRRAGVPFEVVPGVTAGLGALAYAGIPLTHRGLATSALFITAQEGAGPDDDERWRPAAEIEGTVVVYMGGGRVREITERLIRLGRKPETPSALVESGTLARQRVVTGRLDQLADRVVGLTGPALIVIGEVARLRDQLGWVARGPLSGRTVLVARARSQRSWVAASLRELGASVVEFPRVRSTPGPDVADVPGALAALDGRGIVVFTGAAAVRGTLRALKRGGMDLRALAGLTLVPVGRGTIEALTRAELRADLPIRSYVPIRVAAALRKHAGPLAGLPVVVLRDGDASSALGDSLEAAGAGVTQLQVAGRRIDARGRRGIERLASGGQIDAVVLPSSSAVEALMAGGVTIPDGVTTLAIGPATAATAERVGMTAAEVPIGSGMDALVADLVQRLGWTLPAERLAAEASS